MEAQILESSTNIVILDEAHYLKNTGTKRTETLLPIVTSLKRVILLTGTPAFARPRELYNLLHALRPDIFRTFKDFGNRYCDPKPSRWTGGMDYDGACHSNELHYILQNSVMIRRLKKDVLSELPPKRRQKIQVQTDSKIVSQIQALLNKNSKKDSGNNYTRVVNDLINRQFNVGDDVDAEMSAMERGEAGEALQAINQCYSLTGLAKLKGTREYIKDVLASDVKFLLFAHHMEVLDGLEEEVAAQKVGYVRIDGKTSHKIRQDLVDQFQQDPDVKVAILSITACGVGLNLTAASTVIFAEVNKLIPFFLASLVS